jgi:hypothetical protein
VQRVLLGLEHPALVDPVPRDTTEPAHIVARRHISPLEICAAASEGLQMSKGASLDLAIAARRMSRLKQMTVLEPMSRNIAQLAHVIAWRWDHGLGGYWRAVL